ncbi:hypothetical protein AB0K88_31215 [Streptomyces werraensis]|uniref:hypothetical protein n=1 Tax=Streptomyces werraensis TaxID=68284 RepID=UPI0034472747
MILASTAFAMATIALTLAIRTARQARRLTRQTHADLYRAAIHTSGANYYRRRANAKH